jgi:hypothetical protein
VALYKLEAVLFHFSNLPLVSNLYNSLIFPERKTDLLIQEWLKLFWKGPRSFTWWDILVKLKDLSHVDRVGKHECVDANHAARCILIEILPGCRIKYGRWCCMGRECSKVISLRVTLVKEIYFVEWIMMSSTQMIDWAESSFHIHQVMLLRWRRSDKSCMCIL